eukprot:2138367-Heterocapsa_arctica.AAC.1
MVNHWVSPTRAGLVFETFGGYCTPIIIELATYMCALARVISNILQVPELEGHIMKSNDPTCWL